MDCMGGYKDVWGLGVRVQGFLKLGYLFGGLSSGGRGSTRKFCLPKSTPQTVAAQKEGSGKEDGFGRDEYGRIRT